MADAGARRHDTEIVKGLLAPFQEGVAFDVAFVFAFHVHLEGARVAELVDHHRVVDHQIHRVQRVDLLRVAPQPDDAVAHRRKVHHRRHPGKVLHQHARRAIGDLARGPAAIRGPVGKGADVVQRHRLAVLEAQHVFQHDLQRRRQARKVAQTRRLCSRDRVIGERAAALCKSPARSGAVLANNYGHRGILHRFGACAWPCYCRSRGGVARRLAALYTVVHNLSSPVFAPR